MVPTNLDGISIFIQGSSVQKDDSKGYMFRPVNFFLSNNKLKKKFAQNFKSIVVFFSFRKNY